MQWRLGSGEAGLQGVYGSVHVYYIKLGWSLLLGAGYCPSQDHGVHHKINQFYKDAGTWACSLSLHYPDNSKKATVIGWDVKTVMSMSSLSQMIPKRGLFCSKGRWKYLIQWLCSFFVGFQSDLQDCHLHFRERAIFMSSQMQTLPGSEMLILKDSNSLHLWTSFGRVICQWACAKCAQIFRDEEDYLLGKRLPWNI